jgi:hypothetical protein
MTAESLHPARPLMRETADVAHAVAHLTIDDRDISTGIPTHKGHETGRLGGDLPHWRMNNRLGNNSTDASVELGAVLNNAAAMVAESQAARRGT